MVAIPLALLALTLVVLLAFALLERSSGDVEAARRREQPLAHRLPYWAFVADQGVGVVVSVDLTYTSVLELAGLDTDCLDNAALNHINQQLHALFANVEPGTTFQLLYLADHDVSPIVDRYRSAATGRNPMGRRLVEAKAKDVLGRGGLRRTRLFMAVSTPNTAQTAIQQATGFIRPFPSFTHADHVHQLRGLATLRAQVEHNLRSAGIAARPLGVDAIRAVAYELLNPDRAVPFAATPAAAPWHDLQTAREQLAFTAMEERERDVVVGDQIHRVLTLKLLPTTTEPAMLDALLLAVPPPGRVCLGVRVLDTQAVVDKLRRRREQARMLAEGRKRNNDAEAQYQDLDQLIDQNLQSSMRMTSVSVTVVLSVSRSDPRAESVLDQQTAELLRVVSSLHGAQAMVDERNQLDEWLATLPGFAHHGKRWKQCTSENATHLLLAWQSWQGSASPALLLYGGRHNLIGLDPFNAELVNPNAFMAGASGSGKSTTTNYILMNLLAADVGVLIVDVGGSYRRLIEIFGGSYFQIGDSTHGHSLNPFFDHADIVLASGELEEQRAQVLLAVVERMLHDVHRTELGNEERGVLIRAVAETYRRVLDRTPLLQDLVAVLRDMPGEDAEDVQTARGFARGLRVWVEGPNGRIVNRPSTVSLTTACAAFDLKGVEKQPHLRDVLMLTISGVIWNLVMRDPSARKTVVFDECWKFLGTRSSAQLIEELYRTSRKYHCSILTISQAVEDFVGSDIAGALIHNSATRYLLLRADGHDEVGDLFKLNDREKYVFSKLEKSPGHYTEALVLHGTHHFLARVMLTSREYWMATTDPKDLRVEADFRARNPGLSQLELVDLLARHYPNGAVGAPAALHAAA